MPPRLADRLRITLDFIRGSAKEAAKAGGFEAALYYELHAKNVEEAAAALDRTEALEQALQPYLKDGETVAECVARNRRDVDTMLWLLATEKRRHERLEAALLELADHAGYGAVIRHALLVPTETTEEPR